MPTIVTAAAVRDYFNADAKRLALLSDEARKTVERVEGKSPRGRIHPEARKMHDKRRRVSYVEGSSTEAAAKARAEAKALRESLRAQGMKVGARGPLPKA